MDGSTFLKNKKNVNPFEKYVCRSMPENFV